VGVENKPLWFPGQPRRHVSAACLPREREAHLRVTVSGRPPHFLWTDHLNYLGRVHGFVDFLQPVPIAGETLNPTHEGCLFCVSSAHGEQGQEGLSSILQMCKPRLLACGKIRRIERQERVHQSLPTRFLA
jgi:hypothetical protein